MKKTDTKPAIVPVRLPSALHDEIKGAAESTSLSQQDTIRLAIERGLPLLVKAMALTGEELAALPETPAKAA